MMPELFKTGKNVRLFTRCYRAYERWTTFQICVDEIGMSQSDSTSEEYIILKWYNSSLCIVDRSAHIQTIIHSHQVIGTTCCTSKLWNNSHVLFLHRLQIFRLSKAGSFSGVDSRISFLQRKIDTFTYLGSCTLPSGRTYNELDWHSLN